MPISRSTILTILICATSLLIISAHHQTGSVVVVTAAVTCDKYSTGSASFCGDILDKWNYQISSQVDRDLGNYGAATEFNKHNITLGTTNTCKTAILAMVCSYAMPYCQGNHYQIRPCQSICKAARDACDASVLFYPVESIKNYCNQIDAMPCFDGTKVVTNSGVKTTTLAKSSGVVALWLVSVLISLFVL